MCYIMVNVVVSTFHDFMGLTVREKKHLIEQSYNIKSFKQREDNEMFLYLFLFHQREMKLI